LTPGPFSPRLIHGLRDGTWGEADGEKMTDEQNRKLVEDYMNAWSAADANKLDRLLDNGFKFNNPPPGITPDKRGALAMAQMFRKAFPDMKIKLEKWVVQGDNVAVRFVGSGTHKGEFMGVPPTGKMTKTTGIGIVTVRKGKIVEDVTEFDALGLMTQIGAIPEATVAGR
jgi:steroid delta-isomerase-like uncharacterized protein